MALTDTEILDAYKSKESLQGRVAITWVDHENKTVLTDVGRMAARAIEAAATTPLLERIAALEAENHNLNWALGTEGFDQMATPEEQAEHEKGHAEVMANIDRLKSRRERHDQLVPDGVDYLDLIEALTAQVEKSEVKTHESGGIKTGQVEQAAQPFGYWHVGETEEESDFFLHSESGDVSCENCVKLYTSPPKAAPLTDEQHPDDAAVDHFSVAMKAKLSEARAKGRGGWENCDPYVLSDMLRAHVEKGDPRDVANFCMFLHLLGHGIYKPSIRPDLAAVLQELDTPIAGHLGSHSGEFVPGASNDSRAFDAFESAIPLVSWADHERSCRKIAALSSAPQTNSAQLQMLSEFEEGTLVIEHMGPAALAGDSMSLMDAFDKGVKAGQSALAAKNRMELK